MKYWALIMSRREKNTRILHGIILLPKSRKNIDRPGNDLD